MSSPNKFKDFFKFIHFFQKHGKPGTGQSVGIKKVDSDLEAKNKVDDLFSEAISSLDKEKIEMILQRNFIMNSYHFYYLSAKLKDDKLSSEILNTALKEKYHHDIKHEIDKKLLDLSQKDLNEEDSYHDIWQLVKNIMMAWSKYDKQKDLEDNEYALEFRELLKNVDFTLHKLYNPGGYEHDEIGKFTKVIRNFRGIIEANNKEYYEQLKITTRKAELLKFSQQLNECSNAFNSVKTLKEHIKIGLRENINKLASLKMPLNAQILVEEISTIANDIAPFKLNAKQSLDFDNFYQKRLPQVLEEYINISPRYREKLKGHNEDPDLILQDSLLEIKSKMNEIFEDIQMAHHNQQKVTRQYLKTV